MLADPPCVAALGLGGSGPSFPSLYEAARAVQAAGREGHVGPLRAGLALAEILDAWETRGYAREANGLDAASWAAQHFGNKQAATNARRAAAAVDTLTALDLPRERVVLSKLDHRVAVYLAGKSIPSERRLACVTAVLEVQRRSGPGTFLSYVMARALCVDLLQKQSVRKAYGRLVGIALGHIEQLERLLRAAGKPVPPRPVELSD